MNCETALAERLVHAVVARDRTALASVVEPSVDFRGLTPNRTWEATDVDGLADILWEWFGPEDRVEEIVRLDVDQIADRHVVTYRLRGTNENGPFLVEQHGYFTATDGRIGWLRMICSGFRSDEHR